jgi:hypothetical protein
MRTKRTEVDRVVADIELVRKHVERQWHRNRAPMGVMGAAQHLKHVDLGALRIVLDYILDAPYERGFVRPGERRAVDAANRLEAALGQIEARRTEIAAQLRAA